jgi:hypothetical protein
MIAVVENFTARASLRKEERHRAAEHRGGLLGVAHLEDAALLREWQPFAAQAVAQIMHG